MERLNYFWPDTVFTDGTSYYISRPWFLNELTNHFDVHYFCAVRETSSIDQEVYDCINPDVEIHDFFDHFSIKRFLIEKERFKSDISKQCDLDEDFFFVMYPYNQISAGLAWILRETKLTLWVKVRLLEAFRNYPEDPRHKRILKSVAKPFLRSVYKPASRYLLENQLVFYTGDILFDTSNHINQYSITSVSRLNETPDQVETQLQNKMIFIGDESRLKGLGYLLKALESLDEPTELTILGISELEKYSEYEASDFVNVVGEIYDEEVFYRILSNHDILLMPSASESQGKVQLEAMSAGVVPICADVGGIHTTIQNMYNGLLFDREEPEHLVKLIEALYQNPALYSQLVKNGREYAERFSIERQVEIMATTMKNYYGNPDLKSIYSS